MFCVLQSTEILLDSLINFNADFMSILPIFLPKNLGFTKSIAICACFNPIKPIIFLSFFAMMRVSNCPNAPRTSSLILFKSLESKK